MRFCHVVTALFVVVAMTSAQAQEKYRVYFGTYTGETSKGIYRCELNVKNGFLSKAKLAVETSSPSFLAFHPTANFFMLSMKVKQPLAPSRSMTRPETLPFSTPGRRRVEHRVILWWTRQAEMFSLRITVVVAVSASRSKPMAS